jgi:hypothetical protein
MCAITAARNATIRLFVVVVVVVVVVVIVYDCSVLQYIGEMCRYAVATEADDADRQSGLRIAIGNGLRSEIWQEVKNTNNNHNIRANFQQ